MPSRDPIRPLRPLPDQPQGVPWPTREWPERRSHDPELNRLVEAMFAEPAPADLGHTHALLVVHGGEVVAERYGQWFVGELEALDGKEPTPVRPEHTHISWSMAKSVLHGVIGLLVMDGALALDDRPPIPQWTTDPDDPRGAITWDHLLQMRPGLQWVEEYYEFAGDQLPDVFTMLYGEGRHDMATFAAGFPLVHEPGSDEAYSYSSGTSNIVAAAAQRVIGDGHDDGGEQDTRTFLSQRLFGPLGMTSAEPRFDHAGTFVASSYLYATARDFARFGLLYLRDGVWEGERLLPEGWVDHGRRARSWDEPRFHGAHWWAEDDEAGTFLADGFEGQRIICVPALDLVIVRLGKSQTSDAGGLDAHLSAIAARFA